MSYDFQTFCSISISPRRLQILFSFKLDTSRKTGALKKIKTFAKKVADNSEPLPSKIKKYCVKFSDFVSCTVCGRDFSLAHGGGNDISRHKDTSNNDEYVDVPQRQRKLTSFGLCSVTATLKQKVVKVELLFFWFFG